MINKAVKAVTNTNPKGLEPKGTGTFIPHNPEIILGNMRIIVAPVSLFTMVLTLLDMMVDIVCIELSRILE